uniref:Uncharacterized protein n=1 Tax=Brassica campestris TaxID=3711 RepID=M4F632_BRACM
MKTVQKTGSLCMNNQPCLHSNHNPNVSCSPQNIDLEIRHAFLGRFILDWVHWPQRKESKRLPEEGPYVITFLLVLSIVSQ